jgi:hypothetical protein
MAANIFTGATDNNWGTATNWSQGTVPTTTDTYITTFDATSPSCTVNTTARGCNGIDFSAYVNTITMTNIINVYGDCTLGAGMTIVGTGDISSDGTAVTYTWTSNGKTWPNNVTLHTGPTAWIFADDWTISGDLITATIVINSSTLYIGGNFVCGANTGGTTAIVLNGTGTWTGGTCRNDLTINTAGTITISGTVGYNTGTLTYTAGIVDTTGSTLFLTNVGTPTLATNGISWNNITMNTGTTVTLTNALDVNGTFTYGSGSSSVTLNGSTATFSGNIKASGTTDSGSTLLGTTNITIDGTGTWSHSSLFNAIITNNLTINTAGTLTIGSKIGYNTGTLTYTAGTVVTSGSTLSISASTTLDTDRGATKITWNNVTLGGTLTLTLTTALNISGTFIPCTGGVTVTINTSTVNIGGNLSVQGSGGIVTGTSLFNINGTGTWSHTSSTALRNNVNIDTVGTLTISGTVNYNTGTLTYTAGTITTTGSTLTIILSTTLNTSGMTWNNISISGASQTYTLISNLNCNGTFNSSVTGIGLINGLYNINCSGSLIIGASGLGAGTATFVMTGTGTMTCATGALRNNLTINTAGTITFQSGFNFVYSTGTLTYTAGTIVTSGNTLLINASTTLDTSGINWYNVTISTVSQTVTINSLLNITNTLTTSVSSVIFAGTSGWTTLNFSSITAGVTHTLASTKTYTITGLFTITGTSASRIVFVSSIPGSQAILTLANNGTSSQNIDFCNATDIDSSAGLTIWSYKGVLSNVTNWAVMPTQRDTVSYAA